MLSSGDGNILSVKGYKYNLEAPTDMSIKHHKTDILSGDLDKIRHDTDFVSAKK